MMAYDSRIFLWNSSISSLIPQMPVSLHFLQSLQPEIFFLSRIIFSTSAPASLAPARASSRRISLLPPTRGLPIMPSTFIFNLLPNLNYNTNSLSLANFVGCVVGVLNPPRRTYVASSLPPHYPLKSKWYKNLRILVNICQFINSFGMICKYKKVEELYN